MSDKAAGIETTMRRFHLVRTADVSGVSGTGLVAEGCEFSNGICAMTWLTRYRSTTIYDSVKELDAVHSHGGATKVVWLDGPLS